MLADKIGCGALYMGNCSNSLKPRGLLSASEKVSCVSGGSQGHSDGCLISLSGTEVFGGELSPCEGSVLSMPRVLGLDQGLRADLMSPWSCQVFTDMWLCFCAVRPGPRADFPVPLLW